MNKYRFIRACETRQFNLINIYLLIFPFGRCAPVATPWITPTLHVLSRVLLPVVGRCEEVTCARGGKMRGVPSNYFIRGIPAYLFARLFCAC